MNSRQRVTTSIALGAVLTVIASVVTARLNDTPEGGWFMYSPDSTSLYGASSNGDTLIAVAVWLTAIAIWFGVSWRLFRSDK